MKTVAIIQARMGSSRLPGKVLLDLAGQPMLARVLRRVSRASRVDEVLVATTTEPRDDAIANFCAEAGWACFRGSEQDVLDRYYQAALSRGAEIVVRITSDCPLMDAELIDAAIHALERQRAAYAANVLQRSYPRGLDVEAFTFTALETAWREDRNPAWREHVTQFLVRHPERFAQASVVGDEDHSSFRWTVDTLEDYALVERIYAHFGSDDFSWKAVLELLGRHPEWVALNEHVEQKAV